jgi:hypothetical protein
MARIAQAAIDALFKKSGMTLCGEAQRFRQDS